MTPLRLDPTFMTVHALSKAIGDGTLTSAEIIECCLNQITTHDAKLHAFVAVYADEARIAAKAADLAIRSGHHLGPLHGIPIALKDIIDIEGRITTGGSQAWLNRISPTTATIAQRLISAGMIIIGKTHSVEFAMGGWGTNTHMGTPWNPWDLETHRTPGGSSSGSGVAVAAGMVPAAIGTDTGGSVRLPASFCGLTGLKTTAGQISLHGILPLSTTLDTPGPMTRSVEDAAMIYNAIQGPDPLWPTTLNHDIQNPFSDLRRGVDGLRLAVISKNERVGVDVPTLAAFDATQDILRALGASIKEIEMPRRFSDFAAIAGRIIGAEAYRFVGSLADNPRLPIDPNVRQRIKLGNNIIAHEYIDALADQQTAIAEYREAMLDFDALLLPSTETPAIPLVEVDESSTPARFTRAGNCLKLSALSLPNGASPDGLPTSVQIACRGNDEAMALRIGWALEQATDWHNKHPRLSAK